jgi:signal peptidase I
VDFTSLIAQSQPGEPAGLLGLIDKLARTQLSTIVMVVAACTVVRILLSLTVLKPTPIHLRPNGYGIGKFINEFCDAVIYAGVFVFMVIRPFLIQTFYIPTGSMVDKLLVNDYIVANKLIYRYTDPERLDIIVFKPPKEGLLDPNADQDYIKRLIGLPGDTVEIRGGELFINGKLTEEPYRRYSVDVTPGEPKGKIYRILPPTEQLMIAKPDFKFVEHKGELWPVQSFQGQVNVMNLVAQKYVATDPAEAEQLLAAPPAKIPAGYYLFMGDNRNNSFDGRSWGLVKRDAIVGRAEAIWMPINRLGRLRHGE